MAETIFADGISVFEPNAKAPEWVKLDVSVNPERLAAWARDNKQYISDRGFLKLQIKKSTKGVFYIDVNTFVPQKQEAPKQPSGEAYPMDDHGAVAAYEQEAAQTSYSDLGVPDDQILF